ncbi:Pseudouridine synthase/archaeosine transglycosylase [Corchorus olitorius]|uniref:Pseudouridine synthase/archaeosine transglycosylase n=1 Tax=Corchorus olitorius TaxID=93759 RepID=A0A1R3I5P7_9ROSI|nr:Pseudouridine synthase/archaeosine transglycosylase [Corchorus olitorius]
MQQVQGRLIKSLSFSRLPLSLPPSSSSTLQRISSSHAKGVAKVVLKKGKTQLFKDGSPMVYSGAIDRIIGRPPPKTGDIVLVADGTEKPIGWGLYNSVSMFCVRLMQLEEEATRDPSCMLDMEKLLETRINAAIELRRGLGLPSATTNAYRLVNSEGDRVFEVLHRAAAVTENGISYAISLEGQKTGFYADQRENRMFLSTLSNGRKVLDICCYSGGFSLNAAKGGALSVTGVDTSLPAIELARENIALNNLDPGKISFLKEDANAFMKAALSRNESWDIVILDPPKLAPSKKGAASMAGRRITVVREAGAACDHPIDPSYPEGAYLSNVLLRVL